MVIACGRPAPGDVVSGLTRDGWSWLELVEYPSRAAVIELVTSSDYRALRGPPAMPRWSAPRCLLQRRRHRSQTTGANAYAVRLLVGARGDSLATYAAEWSNQDDVVLARHHGTIVWRARVDPIVVDSNQRFNAMFVYGFPDDGST